MDFLSVKNFKFCSDIFYKYMDDEYGVKINAGGSDDSGVRVQMYNIMQDVHGKFQSKPNASLKEMNNVVLNEMRDVYLSKVNISANSKKPRMRNLERDQQVYGNRQVQLGEQLMFEMNPPKRDDQKLSKSVEDIMNERSGGRAQPAKNLPFEVVKVPDAPSSEDLLRRMEDIEKAREGDVMSRFQGTLEISNIQKNMNNDPKLLYTNESLIKAPKSKEQLAEEERTLKTAPYTNYSEQALIAPTSNTYEKKTYVLFNGYDRLWDMHPYRYNFVIDVNNVTRSIRNITEIAFTRLIIPMEVLSTKKTSTATDTSTRYYNQYGLTYPYLMLQIDELTPGMYEGFNKTTQKCFTSFVFHREYRASNGRGFIVMQPLQDEKREYRGNPLTTLPRMSVRIVKPNGTLYNMAKDDNRVNFLVYESVNPLLLKIVCKDYFDINEYAVGDVVMMKDFKLMSPDAFANAVSAGGGTVTNSDLAKYSAGMIAVEEFMNRDEGHEIIMTGDANQSTFMNSFSIFMPRMLDKTQGSMVLQKDFFDLVNACQTYLNKVPHVNNGRMMNSTLQIVLTMKVKTISSDISQVSTNAITTRI